MACLSIATGRFATPTWVTSNQTDSTADGSIQLNNTGSNPGITITRRGSTVSLFIPKLGSLKLGYIVQGNHIWVLSAEEGSTSSTRKVFLIISEPARFREEEVFVFSTVDDRQANPQLWVSPGAADLFALTCDSGDATVTLPVRISPVMSSFTGRAINSDSFSDADDNQPFSVEATAANIIVRFSNSFGPDRRTIELPEFNSRITPERSSFPVAVIGTADPALAITQNRFTITNRGSNCMQITTIQDADPYFLTAASRAQFPVTIDAGDELTVDVEFRPAATRSFDGVRLPLVPTIPAGRGDAALICNGNARAATRELRISRNEIPFGLVPVATTVRESFTITNTGEVAENMEVLAPPPVGVIRYTWAAVAPTTLAPGSAPVTVQINYTPDGEDEDLGTVTVRSSFFRTGSAEVRLTGRGCIPRPVIQPPPTPFSPPFGNVRRGFRTVRPVTVRNTGNGPLSFRARIEGADAALFGIQTIGGSIFTPSASERFTVNPVRMCGAGTTGTGAISFGLVFFADRLPGSAIDARLVIDDHNDTRTGVDREFLYPLAVNILAGIAVDATLVIDRSGSMAEPSGARSSKIDAAIEAGQLFVRLMRADVGDRVGLVKFNQEPRLVQTITEVVPGNQSTLAGLIRRSDFNPEGTTSIAGGVMTAVKDQRDNPRGLPPADSYNKAIITITDGIDNAPYLNPEDGVTYSLLGEDGNTPMPVPAGMKLYAIGIGNSVDEARLGHLATSTGGAYLQVEEFTGQQFFALEKYLTQIYMDLVDMATVRDPVYTIRNGEEHVNEFDVLKGDTDAMVVIYDTDGIRLPFYLLTPTGETIDAGGTLPSGYQLRTSITGAGRFVEVSMPQLEPGRYAGRWKVVLMHDGQACYYTNPNDKKGAEDNTRFGPGFRPLTCKKHEEPIVYGIAIGASSNFRMTPYVQPGIVKTGEPILLSAAVSEAGLPVTGATVTVEVHTPDNRVLHMRLHDDGRHQDDEADDGMYAQAFTQTFAEGAYTFTFRTQGQSRDGEPVTREAVRSKYVEGRQKLIPENPLAPAKGSDCCTKGMRLLWAMIILMVIMIVILLTRF